MKSDKATYSGFQFETDGYPALAIINADLKKKEDRFDYPYSVFIEIIPDTFNEDGHPDGEEYDYLIDVEKEILEYLESQTQTVHVGHTTVYRKREIILYTREKEKVEGFLGYFLPTIERETHFEIEEDRNWENVSAFYDLI